MFRWYFSHFEYVEVFWRFQDYFGAFMGILQFIDLWDVGLVIGILC